MGNLPGEIVSDNTILINKVAYERKGDIINMPTKYIKQMKTLFLFVKASINQDAQLPIDLMIKIDEWEKALQSLGEYVLGKEAFARAVPNIEDLDVKTQFELATKFISQK